MEKRRISFAFLVLAVYAAALSGFVFGGYVAVHDQTKTMQLALNN